MAVPAVQELLRKRNIDASEIDCLISGRTPSAYTEGRLRRLFADFGAEEKAYYSRTRVFPIMHTIVVKRALIGRLPDAVRLLMTRFEAAKAAAEEGLANFDVSTYPLPWLAAYVEDARAQMGAQLWPYGIEANRPNIQGETFDPPGLRDVGSTFLPELKGGEVHYSRHNAETDKFEVAFVDRGDRVDIHDWTRRDSILAAMKLSSQKWDAITVNGSASYNTAVVELAVEHGFAVSNPELQDKIRIEQDRAARQRETDAPAAQRSVETNGVQSGFGSEAAIHVASPSPPLAATPGETQIALDQVRAQTEREAALETRQATEARRLGETTAASGTAEHPYRSGQEARTAQDAARAMENNPSQPTLAEPGQSEKVQELSREQRSYLQQAKLNNEEEAARSRTDDKSHDEER